MSVEKDPTKPFILWSHDPCQEGGWQIQGTFDTKEEAVAAAHKHHAMEVEHHRRMVEHCAQDGEKWERKNNCYDKCMVTGGELYRLEAPNSP